MSIGAFGAGLSLADMLRLRSNASPADQPRARPKSAIMIFLGGGPTHMDMWDLKPDAPAEFRGEFRPIAAQVPGVQICEHFPLQARMWDKLTVIRSLEGDDAHRDYLVMTGYKSSQNRTLNPPSFGSVVSRLRGNQASVPPYVSLRPIAPGSEGYLGLSHQPFTTNGQGFKSLAPQPAVNAARLQDRRDMLSAFDGVRRDLDSNVADMDSLTTRAIEMVANGGVRRALDLNHEPTASRQRYRYVEQFLIARRLVEAGVGCVTLTCGTWDTHNNAFPTLRRQLPLLDRGIANLVHDLHERGMGDDVVVIAWGEFGRTPRINQRTAGRDHWPAVMSALIAGGGLRMGQAIGASSDRGERIQDGRCTASQVLATIYRAIGIDPARTIPDSTRRPRFILDDRRPIRELV